MKIDGRFLGRTYSVIGLGAKKLGQGESTYAEYPRYAGN